MAVDIDEPGCDQSAGSVDHPRGGRVNAGGDPYNFAAPHGNIRAVWGLSGAIHDCSVLNQKISHKDRLRISKGRGNTR